MGEPKKRAGIEPFTHLRAIEIGTFCELHSICRSSFYNMLKRNEGPRLTRVGKRVLITPEALEEWRKARTDPEPVTAAE